MRKPIIGLIIALVVQFTLGMILNLFVKLPDTHPGTTGSYLTERLPQGLGWAFIGGGGIWLALHAIIGTLLVTGAIALIVRAHRSHIRKLIVFAWLGFLFILSAWINGANFIDLGGHDANSFVMALSFLIAYSFYQAMLRKLS